MVQCTKINRGWRLIAQRLVARACKLAALVAVEYLTALVLQQTTYRLYAKIGVQGRAKLPV